MGPTKGIKLFPPCSVLGWNLSGVSLERAGLALPFSQGRLAQLLPFHRPCSSVLGLQELTCADPPGPRSVPAWHCVVTLPRSPWPGTCSSTLDDPVGTGPRRRGRRGPAVSELSAGSILEWLSCHCRTCSEDLALAAAVTGTPRW